MRLPRLEAAGAPPAAPPHQSRRVAVAVAFYGEVHHVVARAQVGWGCAVHSCELPFANATRTALATGGAGGDRSHAGVRWYASWKQSTPHFACFLNHSCARLRLLIS